jgi:hypothetical protein
MLELFAWGPGYGHYSLDPFCLSIETYLQLAGVKWVVNESDSNISPTGELPLLKINAEPITGTWNIIKVLKQRGHDLDDRLTQQELFETQAFVALLEEKLHDALVLEVNTVIHLVFGKRELYEVNAPNHVEPLIVSKSIFTSTADQGSSSSAAFQVSSTKGRESCIPSCQRMLPSISQQIGRQRILLWVKVRMINETNDSGCFRFWTFSPSLLSFPCGAQTIFDFDI